MKRMGRRGYLWGFLALYSIIYFQACMAIATVAQHCSINQKMSQKPKISDVDKGGNFDTNWIEKMAYKPLFSADHQPLAPVAVPYPDLSRSRLSAILFGFRYHAIILVLPDGESVILSKGDSIGSALVTSITPLEADFKQSEKSIVLRTTSAIEKRINLEAKSPIGNYFPRRSRSKEIGDPYFLTLVRPPPSGQLYCDPTAEQECQE